MTTIPPSPFTTRGSQPTAPALEAVPSRGGLVADGEVLGGRYRVGAAIGFGGFSQVFEGVQLNIDRPVAIKILDVPHRSGQRASAMSRFVQEARLAANLVHPSVVSIFDFGATAAGAPFIVMERLVGSTLEELVNEEGPLDPRRAMLLAVRCLDGLAEAHDRGVVHRDIKPSNIFVVEPGTPFERPCLLDFGLAYWSQPSLGRLTQSGHIHGTPQFLAPEYIQAGVVGPALDVYQMGLVLVEALTGFPAVESTNAWECFTRHCRGDLNLPMGLQQEPIWPLLDRALALSHTDRFSDARAMRDACVRHLREVGEPLLDDDLEVDPLIASSRLREPCVAPEPPMASPVPTASMPIGMHMTPDAMPTSGSARVHHPDPAHQVALGELLEGDPAEPLPPRLSDSDVDLGLAEYVAPDEVRAGLRRPWGLALAMAALCLVVALPLLGLALGDGPVVATARPTQRTPGSGAPDVRSPSSPLRPEEVDVGPPAPWGEATTQQSPAELPDPAATPEEPERTKAPGGRRSRPANKARRAPALEFFQ